jgi:hypothetical protein
MTDPMHNDRDLQNGLYILERYMGFSLEDIDLVFRHSRPAVVGYLAQLGAALNPDGSTDPIPAAADKLRKLLCEAKDVARQDT